MKTTKGIGTLFFSSIKSKSKFIIEPLDKPDDEIWKDIWSLFIK